MLLQGYACARFNIFYVLVASESACLQTAIYCPVFASLEYFVDEGRDGGKKFAVPVFFTTFAAYFKLGKWQTPLALNLQTTDEERHPPRIQRRCILRYIERLQI
jgi:hypothetical protein